MWDTKTETLDEVIDMTIRAMSESSPSGLVASGIRPSYFNGAEPMFNADLFGSINSKTDERLFVPDVSPRDVKILDHSFLGSMEDKEFMFCARRYRQVEAKDCRGKIAMALPLIIEEAMCAFRWSGTYIGAKNYYGTSNLAVPVADAKWYELTADRPHTKKRINGENSKYPKETMKGMQASYAQQFNKDYEWYVHLGYASSISIAFCTDPTGAREVFRLRDLPEGKTRRAALRNWVTEHWRKKRSDPNEEVKVREHLRGATRFTWNGLQCLIRPSKSDLIRARLAPDGGAR